MSRGRRHGAPRTRGRGLPESDPLWYKDAVIYELRVGAFQDGDGDGVGDFRGLTERLDYLHDLGVNTLWLLPFCPSPLRDDGYDISDYTDVHPQVGTLDDFKLFLREAHGRGLRVVTEVVINHTSDQHPWFQRARRAPPGSRHRDFYVWSDTPERYGEARIIFKDFEHSNWSWDPIAKAYYWHRFYSHQPDLNFESPDVRKAVFRFVDFWLGLGVDGLRLDAIPYLFEREGTNCENLPETHAFLKDLRSHVDSRYRDRMLLAEANQWPEDAVAYFGQGDECHMAFHFPVMPRLFMALHMEDRYPIIEILEQTPALPETCQWALFLRNHDELTLEMVTDEERDYMYRVYANDAQARINLGIRRRLGPLLGNDRRRIELMNALLFSLPGTPVIYYGDEIGMGDNFYLGDRNGVRTPMQWSSDRNAGFSRSNPQRLYLPIIIDPEYHYEAINVEAQQSNPHSLLHWMKRLIDLRKRHPAFGRGSIEFLYPRNHKVLVFVRSHEDERILVVANLSRFVEYVEIDLSAYKGMVAVEVFGGRPFPPIGELPYLLTLGPHAFYWFRIAPPALAPGAEAPGGPGRLPRIQVEKSWENAFREPGREALEAILPEILRDRRWFGGKAREITSARVVETIWIREGSSPAVIALVGVEQEQAAPATYAVPVAFASGLEADTLRRDRPRAVLAEVEVRARDGAETGLLYDGLESPELAATLLDAIRRRRVLRGDSGELAATRTRAFRELRGAEDSALPASVMRAEQSNTSVVYGERLILKVFRRVSDGVNPDLELGRFLTERARFPQIPVVAGALEYRAGRAEPRTLGILQAYVANEGDAWRFTLDQVESYYERALASAAQAPVHDESALVLAEQEPPELAGEMGAYLETARLLGQRTAELHLALASDADDPDFAPEPFTSLYQRSVYQSMRTAATRTLDLLRQSRGALSEPAAGEAGELLAREDDLLNGFRAIVGVRLGGMRIRVHGDYHLGQILYTGNDFVITDFEGEPARSLSERRLKRSPLRDVAGMLRSFDYAAHTALFGSVERGMLREEDVPALLPWARFWRQWASAAFLRAYLPPVQEAGLVPGGHDELAPLLRLLLLDKAVYELGYELNNRPAWVRVPIRGILDLIPSASTHEDARAPE
ncbi:MAG: maltose alpha-D-glucosyltransferase [Myxococcales bacterium]|nr:maltose alpha-D-glucosyltransferase [Myxococcales bacterium]